MNSKFGLNFYASTLCIFNPKDIKEPELIDLIKSDKYHIYLICKRKKIHFEKFTEKNDIGITTLFYLNNKFEKVYLKYELPTAILRINEVKDELYNIDTQNQKGVWIRDFHIINKFNVLQNDRIELSVKEELPSDLEVMYIGQAFGRTSTKTIDYRIVNHDKIQNIALEILDSGSNEEILIIGAKVKVNDVSFSIVSKGFDNPDRLKNRYGFFSKLRNKAANKITGGQIITIFEASLIKYFQTDLNVIHKSTFPSMDFKSYNNLNDIDFLYSAMTIDTRSIEVRIFSEHQKERSYLNLARFPLKEEKDKISFFDFL